MGVSVDVECTAAAVAVVVVVVVVADERRRQRIERLQRGVVERVVEMRIGDGGGEWRKRVAVGGRGAGGVVVGRRVGEQQRVGGGVVVDVTADRQRRCNEQHQPPPREICRTSHDNLAITAAVGVLFGPRCPALLHRVDVDVHEKVARTRLPAAMRTPSR